MSQRNPTKSEFFTFEGKQQSGAGENFFAVNTSGSKQVVFASDGLGWNITNQPRSSVLDVIGAILETAQYMPLPSCPDNGNNGEASSHLVTSTNDEMLYVFLSPNSKAKRCHVWVIR